MQASTDALLDFPALGDLFPYEQFDPVHNLFYNTDSVGFGLQCPPLLGSSEEDEKALSELFAKIPPGAGVQCLLFGDPRIDVSLAKWETIQQTKQKIFTKLSQERAVFFTF